jgi:cysteine desulfurase
MLPYLTEEFGNAASLTHDYGLLARQAVEDARVSVARLLNAPADDIVFTAGATEANNLALIGAARSARRHGRGAHLVTTAFEHNSVSDTMRALVDEGFSVTEVAPGPDGIVRADTIGHAIQSGTVLVSMIAANAEIGTVQPVAEVGALCRARGILFHTDATQLVGKLPVDVGAMGIDLLALSAHKLYGPKGVGALYAREGVELEPVLFGGGQERGRRPGTLNVPGIVGLGATAGFRFDEMAAEAAALSLLRDALWAGIHRRIPDARLNGHPIRRLPGNLNVSFPDVPSHALLSALGGFALSAGSACHSGTTAPSQVLLAIGVAPELAVCSLRIGLGKGTTPEQVQSLLSSLETGVLRIRGTIEGD